VRGASGIAILENTETENTEIIEYSYDELVTSLASAQVPGRFKQLLKELPRAIADEWSLTHTCDGHTFDCLLDKDLRASDRRSTAIALIRSVVDSNADQYMEGDYSPRMFSLFDDVLGTDIYKLVDAEVGEQTFLKRGKLQGLFERIDEEFNEIDEQFRAVTQFDSYRQKISAFFNGDPMRGLLPTFLSRSMSSGRLQDLFGDLGAYFEPGNRVSPAVFDFSLEKLTEFDSDVAKIPNAYGRSFV
jgi:hypothetical protein